MYVMNEPSTGEAAIYRPVPSNLLHILYQSIIAKRIRFEALKLCDSDKSTQKTPYLKRL
jgi:hypothetical protein